jgi:hypothetical protein
MKTKFVTSFYAHHYGPPIWGARGRSLRYKYSLKTICGMGAEVVCYTDVDNMGFNELTLFKKEHNLENLTIKIYPILQNPYQERVYNIRMDKTFDYNTEIYNHNPTKLQFSYTRPSVIYFMKFHFLELEFEPNINLYWIDSGLSHSGMFPSYLSSYEKDLKPTTIKNTYRTSEWKSYIYDLAFTPQTVEILNNRSNGKMVLICRENVTDCDYINFSKSYGERLELNGLYPSGGVFGGSTNNLLELVKYAQDTINIVLNKKNFLFGDEEILGVIKSKNPDWFNYWKFHTYWHEEYEHYINANYNNNKFISFYKFFIK